MRGFLAHSGVTPIPVLVVLPCSEPVWQHVILRPLFWGLISIFGGICAIYHGFCRCIRSKGQA